MLTWPRILLLSSDDEEFGNWEEILREHATLGRVRNLAELQSSLQDDLHDALFCGWKFISGTWNEALWQSRQQCPDLPVVIFNGTRDEREWVKARSLSEAHGVACDGAGRHILRSAAVPENRLLPQSTDLLEGVYDC